LRRDFPAKRIPFDVVTAADLNSPIGREHSIVMGARLSLTTPRAPSLRELNLVQSSGVPERVDQSPTA
jgi:hypothetical protein